MFKYTGLLTAQERTRYGKGHMGKVYFGHVAIRPFNPLASLGLYCPLRRKAWALPTPVCDYRAAQNSGAPESRDGRWYSRALEQLEGDLERKWPNLDMAPNAIDCAARVSWWPPRATMIWQGRGFYHKLSFRPVTDAPRDWAEIAYADDWVADDFRSRFPEGVYSRTCARHRDGSNATGRFKRDTDEFVTAGEGKFEDNLDVDTARENFHHTEKCRDCTGLDSRME